MKLTMCPNPDCAECGKPRKVLGGCECGTALVPLVVEPKQSDLPNLYVCHSCKSIGPFDTSLLHELATGHFSVALTDAQEKGVRTIWATENRSPIDGAEISQASKLLSTYMMLGTRR